MNTGEYNLAEMNCYSDFLTIDLEDIKKLLTDTKIYALIRYTMLVNDRKLDPKDKEDYYFINLNEYYLHFITMYIDTFLYKNEMSNKIGSVDIEETVNMFRTVEVKIKKYMLEYLMGDSKDLIISISEKLIKIMG